MVLANQLPEVAPERFWRFAYTTVVFVWVPPLHIYLSIWLNLKYKYYISRSIIQICYISEQYLAPI